MDTWSKNSWMPARLKDTKLALLLFFCYSLYRILVWLVWLTRKAYISFAHKQKNNITICQRSLDPIHIVTNYDVGQDFWDIHYAHCYLWLDLLQWLLGIPKGNKGNLCGQSRPLKSMVFRLDGCSLRVAHPCTTLWRNFISLTESRMLRRGSKPFSTHFYFP